MPRPKHTQHENLTASTVDLTGNLAVLGVDVLGGVEAAVIWSPKKQKTAAMLFFYIFGPLLAEFGDGVETPDLQEGFGINEGTSAADFHPPWTLQRQAEPRWSSYVLVSSTGPAAKTKYVSYNDVVI